MLTCWNSVTYHSRFKVFTTTNQIIRNKLFVLFMDLHMNNCWLNTIGQVTIRATLHSLVTDVPL